MMAPSLTVSGRSRVARPLPGVDLVPLVDVAAAVTMFLLGSLAATDAPARPLSDVALPAARGVGATADGGLRLAISPVNVRLGGQLVMDLPGGQPSPDSRDAAGHLGPLAAALGREQARRLAATTTEAEVLAAAASPGLLAVEAAAMLPYGVVDEVLATAAAAGFVSYRLTVLDEATRWAP